MNKFIEVLNDFCRAIVPESQAIRDVIRKKEFWEQFCKEKEGKFELKSTNNKMYNKIQMNIMYNNSVITFKESDTQALKVEYVFSNYADFTFLLTFEDFIERLFKYISNKEIEIGDKEFDSLYLLETNNKNKLLKLLSNKRLKELLVKYKISNFQVRSQNKVSKLFLLGGRQINSKEQLNDIYEIITLTIDSIKSK